MCYERVSEWAPKPSDGVPHRIINYSHVNILHNTMSHSLYSTFYPLLHVCAPVRPQSQCLVGNNLGISRARSHPYWCDPRYWTLLLVSVACLSPSVTHFLPFPLLLSVTPSISRSLPVCLSVSRSLSRVLHSLQELFKSHLTPPASQHYQGAATHLQGALFIKYERSRVCPVVQVLLLGRWSLRFLLVLFLWS